MPALHFPAISIKDQRRNSFDPMIFGEGRRLVNVHLHDFDLAGELTGELVHDRRQRFAGRSAFAPEIDQHRLGALHHLLLEVGRAQPGGFARACWLPITPGHDHSTHQERQQTVHRARPFIVTAKEPQNYGLQASCKAQRLKLSFYTVSR